MFCQRHNQIMQFNFTKNKRHNAVNMSFCKHAESKVILLPCSVNYSVQKNNADHVKVTINNAATVADYMKADLKCYNIVPNFSYKGL